VGTAGRVYFLPMRDRRTGALPRRQRTGAVEGARVFIRLDGLDYEIEFVGMLTLPDTQYIGLA